MNRRQMLPSALIAIAALGLMARQPARAADGTVTGQVRALYVRLADGVFRPLDETDFVPGAGERLYAEVRLADAVRLPRASMFVAVPAGMALLPGDLVQALPGNELRGGRIRMSPLPARDRIVSLQARHDSLVARNYGSPGGMLAAALQSFVNP